MDFGYAIKGLRQVFEIHDDLVRENTTGIGEGHADIDDIAVAGDRVDETKVNDTKIMTGQGVAGIGDRIERRPHFGDGGVLSDGKVMSLPSAQFAQFGFEDLAVGIARQAIDHSHVFRHLVAGQFAVAEGGDAVHIQTFTAL